MTTATPFKIRPWNVARNERDGKNLKVLPAIEPDGRPAVAVLVNGRLVLVLGQENALKLSDNLVDALEQVGK